MKKLKVVFVGHKGVHVILKSFPRYFEQRGWETVNCNFIEEAQRVNDIDLLIVWADEDLYIREYNRWENHPKAIWYAFTAWDRVPLGVKTFQAGTLPSALFLEALRMCA